MHPTIARENLGIFLGTFAFIDIATLIGSSVVPNASLKDLDREVRGFGWLKVIHRVTGRVGYVTPKCLGMFPEHFDLQDEL